MRCGECKEERSNLKHLPDWMLKMMPMFQKEHFCRECHRKILDMCSVEARGRGMTLYEANVEWHQSEKSKIPSYQEYENDFRGGLSPGGLFIP